MLAQVRVPYIPSPHQPGHAAGGGTRNRPTVLLLPLCPPAVPHTAALSRRARERLRETPKQQARRRCLSETQTVPDSPHHLPHIVRRKDSPISPDAITQRSASPYPPMPPFPNEPFHPLRTTALSRSPTAPETNRSPRHVERRQSSGLPLVRHLRRMDTKKPAESPPRDK